MQILSSSDSLQMNKWLFLQALELHSDENIIDLNLSDQLFHAI